ncbi:nuclease-related domain-containing protein [Rummeliibacillus sp. NPDC094406]|uniref:nuclease-related domain-containing protein n=1 Tax=Rummeliibacillus sp. NPDC094406 TaxID=3364511 RepID=UPI00381F34E8
MIVKAYSSTYYLEALKGLIQRLSLSNPKRQELENEYMRIKAGDIGEKVVMDTLEQLQLPYDFYVFHNLSLLLESKIQIDVLILTASYIIIFEVKNIKGSIELRQNPSQLVRTLPNGEVHAFNSPEPQLQEYVHQLKRFFLNQNMNISIYGAIIFPFTTSFIKQTSNKTTILLKNEIKPFLRSMPTSTKCLSNNEIEHWKSYFMRKHKEFNPYPLMNRYKISRETILNGVICSQCGKIGMQRIAFVWFCSNCFNKSTNAHEYAIYDYLKILNNTITNKECREFLRIKDIYQSSRMLKNMNLKKSGTYKNAKYMLPEEDISNR